MSITNTNMQRKDNKRERHSFTLPPDLMKEFREVCEKTHTPRPNYSAAVEEALRRWVEEHRRRGNLDV